MAFPFIYTVAYSARCLWWRLPRYDRPQHCLVHYLHAATDYIRRVGLWPCLSLACFVYVSSVGFLHCYVNYCNCSVHYLALNTDHFVCLSSLVVLPCCLLLFTTSLSYSFMLLSVRPASASVVDFDCSWIVRTQFFWRGCHVPVSYTHLTLPTKRIV